MGSYDFRLPKIDGATDTERIQQLSSYLYQLVGNLNWALNSLESAGQGNLQVVNQEGSTVKITDKEAQATFDSIKNLIIKSADIVESYKNTIKKNFDEVYVASSDFGTYSKNVNTALTENASGIELNTARIETIRGEIEETKTINAYIKAGVFDTPEGETKAQVQIGQGDGDTFSKFASFTADGIYFYMNGNEDAIAKLTTEKLIVSGAEISGNLKLGQYIIDTHDGLDFKWVGD